MLLTIFVHILFFISIVFCFYKYKNYFYIHISTLELSANHPLLICFIRYITCVPRSYSAMSFWLWIRKAAFFRTNVKAFIAILNQMVLISWFCSFISREQIKEKAGHGGRSLLWKSSLFTCKNKILFITSTAIFCGRLRFSITSSS